MRIKLIVNYCGTALVGWQRQRYGSSVQGILEDAIFRLCGEAVCVTGSGRTDSGVHALAQVAHFDLNKDFDMERMVNGLNFYLPKSVRVSSACEVSDEFNARKSAKQKTYVYLMYAASHDNALLADRAARVPPTIDLEKMQKAAAQFVGTHDFYAFMSAGSSAKTTTRTVTNSQILLLNSLQDLTNGDGGVCQMTNGDGGVCQTNGDGGVCQMTNGTQIMVNTTVPVTINAVNTTVPVTTSVGLEQNSLIVYKVTANGFLYNMVRKMTAAIIKAGTGKITPQEISHLIDTKNRANGLGSAEAGGLYLFSVDY